MLRNMNTRLSQNVTKGSEEESQFQVNPVYREAVVKVAMRKALQKNTLPSKFKKHFSIYTPGSDRNNEIKNYEKE